MAADIATLARVHAAPHRGVSPAGSEPVVHVDEVASQVAALYEKVRHVVDYREEHLLRKHFIERAYARNMVLHGETKIARPLVKDLIRAGHLPNDTVADRKVEEIQALVDRVRALRSSLPAELSAERKRRIEEWLRKFAIQAVEEDLFPPLRDRLVADAAYARIQEGLVVHGAMPDGERASLAIFLGVQRAILRADDDQIRFRLFLHLLPGWRDGAGADLEALAARLPDVKKKINRAFRDPLTPHFTKLAARHAVIFHVAGDAIKSAEHDEALEPALRDAQTFEPYAKAAYAKRFAGEKNKLRRFAVLSVISFFISKVAVAFALEIPIQKYLTHDFSLMNTVLNIIIPPALLLLVVASIAMPGKKNGERVVEEAEAVVFGKKRDYVLALPKQGANAAVELFYGAMFVVSFGLVGWLLRAINFSVMDIVIFLLFTSIVAATGVRVYNRANQLNLAEPKRGILTLVLDALILPFVATGSVVISGLAKFNAFLVLTDLLIDLPFQVFVGFLENVSDFLKGKKEGVA